MNQTDTINIPMSEMKPGQIGEIVEGGDKGDIVMRTLKIKVTIPLYHVKPKTLYSAKNRPQITTTMTFQKKINRLPINSREDTQR